MESKLIGSQILVPTKKNILKAAESLILGNLVAFPTETVYGLGASATNEKGVSRIYEVKSRPKNHPLIVHISSFSKLPMWAKEIPNYALDLANEFWPGPMTLILRRTDIAKDFVTGGQDTVGLRIPNNEIALRLLGEFENAGGFGIAAPSANRFGAVSPTSASHVIAELHDNLNHTDLVIDGGNAEIGIESTIIDCTGCGPKILRPGAITKESIATMMPHLMKISENINEIRFPGQFKSHYSPKAKVELDVTPLPGDGMIGLMSITTPDGVLRLACPLDLEEYAQQLYGAFRKADDIGLKRVVAIAPERKGLGVAICDRLRKAASD